MATAYIIHTPSGDRAVALDPHVAAEYVETHYGYPVDVVGVPLVTSGTGTPAPELPQARVRVRAFDPGTSIEAAIAVTRESARRQYEAIYQALATPASDETLVYRITRDGGRWSPSGIRSRRAELEAQGWVVKTGDRERTGSGRWANVYKAVTG